jgi:hypothetical protein
MYTHIHTHTHTQSRERDDAARFAKVMDEAATNTLHKEHMEHEFEMLGEDFEYCCKKLKSCADFLSEWIMYACMYVCMYAYMYVCTHAHMYS